MSVVEETGNPHCLEWQWGFHLVRKKRGRKEDLMKKRRRLTASATFYVYILKSDYVCAITNVRTNCNGIINDL